MFNKFFTLISYFFIFNVTSCFAGNGNNGFQESDEKIQKLNAILKHYEEKIVYDPHNISLILSVADAYYSLKEYPQAIHFYLQALQLDPQNLKIKSSLANSYLGENDLEKSHKLFEEIRKQDPTNAEAIGGVGRIEALQHHLDKAETLYNQSLQINPKDSTILYYLAELKIEQKKYKDAESILNNLLKRDPNATWALDAQKRAQQAPLIEQIKKLEEQGQFSQAVIRYKKQISENPQNTDLYIALGNLYTKMKDYEKAISILQQGIQLKPNATQLRVALGFTYLASGDVTKAEQIFENTLKKGKETPEALAGLGRVAALNQDPQKAESYYNQALAEDPHDVLTLSSLAQLKIEQKKYKEADAIFKQIKQIDPSATWVDKEIEEIRSKPIFDAIANKEKKQEFKEVEKLYYQLIHTFPHQIDNYIRFANFYRSQRQYQKASEIYLEGLRENPNNPQLLLNLAYVYQQNKEYDKSQMIFQELLEKNFLNAEVLAGLGLVRAKVGDFQDAELFYRLALTIKPRDPTTLAYLSELMLEEKKYKEAEELLKQLLQIDPKATWARQSLLRAEYGDRFDEIQSLKNSGNFTEAILRYQQLLATAPDSVEAYLDLGQLYLSMDQYQKAIDLFQLGLEHVPTSIDLKINLGFAYLSANHLSEAKKILQQAYYNDPKNGEALTGLGRIAALTGDKEGALFLYQSALENNPDDLLSLSYFAQFLMEQKEFSKAAKLYSRILKINPKATWAKLGSTQAEHAPQLERIQQQEKAGHDEEAEKELRALVSEDPENDNYYVDLGHFLMRKKKYEEAISIYQQGIEKQPDSIQLKVALSFAYIEKNDLQQAASLLEKVLTQDKENGEALAGLGRIAELNGDTARAYRFYSKALELNPSNLTALTYQADLWMKLGKFDKAQALWERILAINPSAQGVKLAIQDAKNGPLLVEIQKKEAAKDYQGVSTLYQQLILQAPQVEEYQLKEGQFNHRLKEYEKAIHIYQDSLKKFPNSTNLYSALGLTYLSKKDKKNARSAFESALKIDPRNPDALAGLGSVFLLEHDFQSADNLIQKALKIDPQNIAALSSYGNLLMMEKKYSEAEKIYAELMKLRPNETWIHFLYQNAKYGTVLDEIEKLIDEEKYSEAVAKYNFLIKEAPDNPQYYFGLGQSYFRMREYGKAIDVYLDAMAKFPDEHELLVSLGYVYMFNKQLGKAWNALQQADIKDPKNAEILAGLGRLLVLRKENDQAETLFQQALTLNPINLSALIFYSDLLMSEKRYKEAEQAYTKLATLIPKAVWVQRLLKDAQDGPLMDLANEYANREEFELAREIYYQLVLSSPEDPARYLPLGQMYVNLQQYYKGICVYEQGLELDPKSLFLQRAIAFAYIQLADYETSSAILNDLVAKDPTDAESWAGLGRIETLHGSYCRAEEYLALALDIAPENMTALSFFAALKQDELYNFSALDIYSTLMDLNSSPKWVRTGYHGALNAALPTTNVAGAYHQEIQWDPTTKRWSAQYLVYGANALLNYPIDDLLTIWGRCADQIYELKDLLTHVTLYSIDVQRAYLGARRVVNSCFFIDAKVGASNYSRYHRGSFRVNVDTIVEPMVTFTYHRPIEKVVLSFSSDADLVARNFNTNVAKLVGRYFISAAYEREVVTRGWIGLLESNYWYRDFVHNNSQMVLGWFQWRPPIYSENILFRYHLKYQRFAKNIPDYYTYKDQIVNYLQLTFEKYWRVCSADSFYTSVSFGHGWQDTLTRFGQIIVIAPVAGAKPPLLWDRRQYNIATGTMTYKYDQLVFTFAGDYYRDTEKYTMWSLIADLQWRF